MNRKYLTLTLTLILCVILFAGSAWPDFGSFSGNSDYGGRSSSGGSSSRSSSGGSYSSGRTYSSGGSYNSGMNFNINPGYSAGFLSDSGDDELGITFMAIVVVVIFIAISYARSRKKREHEEFNNRNIIIEEAQNLNPISTYREHDPEFNEGRIKSMMSNLYVQMQDTWHDKDISSIRPYFTDEFYSQMDRQLDAFRRTGRTDYTERIAVLSVELKGWKQSGGMDYLIVRLQSRIVSYVLDDRTGKLLSGDMNREKFMEYEIELSRKTGTITNPEGDNVKTETCPHCGAPLKLNASAKCEYCGSVITRVNTNWAVSGMKGISQRTA